MFCFFLSQPAFKTDSDEECQYCEYKYMGEFANQPLDEKDERLISRFIAVPDRIEEVELKETGIPHGVPDGKAEAFRLFLLLGGKEKDGDHDDQHDDGAGILDP